MIVDCFTFHNELEMLELRLETLRDVVDAFVLVEATETFQRQPKPLYYAENKARFSAFNDRIRHVTLRGLPDGTTWARERYQRNAIMRGLAGMDPWTVALVSDVDEIPSPEAVRDIERSNLLLNGDSVAFEQTLYAFTLNWRHVRPWYGTRAVRLRDMGEPQSLRHTLGPRYPGEPVITAGGWSFSSQGGIEAIQAKLQSFSHTSCNRPEYLDPAYLRDCIDSGRSILPNDGNEYVWQDLDETYPPYLLRHLRQYSHWLGKTADVKGIA